MIKIMDKNLRLKFTEKTEQRMGRPKKGLKNRPEREV